MEKQMTPLWETNKAFLIKHRRVTIEIELEPDVFEKIKTAAECEGVSLEEFIELTLMEAVGLSYVDLYCSNKSAEDHVS